jgi:DNA-binding transcriptional MerR regulator
MQVEIFDRPITQRLLYSREQVAEMLGGISIGQVRILERKGLLTGLTLTGGRMSQRYYDHNELVALIDEMKHRACKKNPIERRRLGDHGS